MEGNAEVKYTEVYPWNVRDELEKGNVVYALDKKLFAITNLLQAVTQNTLDIIALGKVETSRFHFWMEVKDGE